MAATKREVIIAIPAEHERDLRGLAELDNTPLDQQYEKAIQDYIADRMAQPGIDEEVKERLRSIGGNACAGDIVLVIPADVAEDLHVIAQSKATAVPIEQLAERAIVQFVNANYPTE